MKYPHTVDIYQRTKTSDSMGGESFAWNLRVSSVKCRFYRAGISGNELQKKITGETEIYDYKVMIGQSVTAGERLLKGTVYYEVLDSYAAAGGSADHHWELKVKQI